MRHITKFIMLLFKFAFEVAALIEFINYVPMPDLVGKTAYAYMYAHGITQIIFAAILWLIATMIFMLFLYMLLKEKQVLAQKLKEEQHPEKIKLNREFRKFKAWSKKMSSTYGEDWMSKIDTFMSAIAMNKKK